VERTFTAHTEDGQEINKKLDSKVVDKKVEIVDVSVQSYSAALFQHLSMFYGKDRKMLEKCQKAF
jgi:hypothetical protein